MHASGGRRGHLNRLSLSVGSSSDGQARDVLKTMKSESPMSTPDRHQYASPSSTTAPPNAGTRDSMSPLHRSLNGSGRRQRPMSMHVGSSMSSPLASPSSAANTSLASLDAALSTPPPSSAIPRSSDHVVVEESLTASGSIAHPLSAAATAETSTPIRDALSPSGSAVDSPSSLRSSAGRRSILGRSAHARRQSSISYARSPSSDSPSFSTGGTPRTSLSAIRDEEEEETDENAQHGTARPSPVPANGAQTPSRMSLERKSIDAPSMAESVSQQSLLGTSPSSINEMNIGPAARSSDLLTFIAKKERKCLDLREGEFAPVPRCVCCALSLTGFVTELQRHETELAALKKKWEQVIQREMAASTSPSSTTISPSHSQSSATTGAASLFSSLTSSLNASTSSQSSSSSHTASGSGITSPSPKPTGSASRRLLTNRHSISVASPSNSTPYFGGGSDLSPQTSPLSAMNGAQQGSALDVQKLAKSWLGGVMKSASTVLEGLAPPPPNDLHTVTEEEEPEDEEEEASTRPVRQRGSAGHPSARRSPHDRKESTATNATSEMSSPSSSCEDGQFSSGMASRSSSVSSLHSDNHRSNNKEGDTTPIATPVLPQGNDHYSDTPRAGDEERDLWALSGDFENEPAREKRENMERNRIDNAKGSPRKEMLSPSSQHSSLNSSSEEGLSPKAVRPANHGRRRSTAFELGGAWGAMVGKKWNEMASQISVNETLRNSSKKAMGLMEGFEKSLNDAITPDPNEQQNQGGSNATQLMFVNGELIPTGDWSPVSSPQQRTTMERRDSEKSLPSGIGGPSAWSALLGRSNSRTTPKSPQSEFAWQDNQHYSDDKQAAVSPSLSNGSNSKMTRSLLDEDDEDQSQDPLNASSTSQTIPTRNALSPTPLTAQERIQASRAKHAKRMSMPVNSMSKTPSPTVASKSTTGLGLEGVNENEEEDESAWGW